MAEKVLFNIAGGIISSVAGPLAAEEVKLFCGVKKELEKTKNTVSAIKAALLDAEERKSKSHTVNDWLEKLNGILYEADDLLDAVSTDALQQELMSQGKITEKVRLFFSKSFQLVYDLKMAHKIKEIRVALDDIAADMREFQFAEHLVEAPFTVTGRDSTYSFVLKDEIIGREDDKEKVIELLMNTNFEVNVSILPIIGIGGLGKTTLAQFIYNDPKIQNYFELRMWVCVSDSFDVKYIVEKMLESIAGEKSNSTEVLVNNLKEKIDKKKYLLVLDDVWNEDPEKWSNLKRVLMNGAIGSRILVTTRAIRVAKVMFGGEPYILQGLKEEASNDLFKRMAFPNAEWPKNPRFQELGKEILKKCVGVPLAVKTVGRLLYFQNTEIEWLNFVKNELSAIDQNDYDILPTLKLSYDKLPSHLKHCFAYCSLYPKDYVYNKTQLIYEWIAHGFVQSSSTNQCLENVGNDYFNDLLWRSFLQEPQTNDLYMLSGCKMHDLMHDLATLVAGPMITKCDHGEWRSNEKIRHLSILGDINFLLNELIYHKKGRMIRTFYCPNFNGTINYEVIFSNFKFLRVLNLSDNGLESLPNNIGKLKHIRHLDLSYNYALRKLPSSFTRLLNLEYLNLRDCRCLTELPKGFKKLVKLMYLELEGCVNLEYLPDGMNQLTNHQVLTKFRINSCCRSGYQAKVSELSGLSMLRGKLEFQNVRHSKALASEYKAINIKGKPGLERLHLHFVYEHQLQDLDVEDETQLEELEPHPNLKEVFMKYYLRSRLPSWIPSITGLVRLKLYNCYGCEFLPPLSHLPSLKDIDLKEMPALRHISDCDDRKTFSPSSASIEFFPSLYNIWITSCPNLKSWWRDSDRSLPSFNELRDLWIEDCPSLSSFPLIQDLVNLHLINCKIGQQIMMVRRSSEVASSSSTPQSKLEVFYAKHVPVLDTLTEEWLEKLTSFQTWKIFSCIGLKSLSLGIQYLTQLKGLQIDDCPQLDLAGDDGGMCWQGLKSLETLKVERLPKLVFLPVGLQYITTLRTLEVDNCENMTSILELFKDEHASQEHAPRDAPRHAPQHAPQHAP